MSKRTAVDVSPDALLLALNLLPFATLGTKCGWYVNKKGQAITFLGEGIEGCAVLELYRRRQHGQSGQAYQHEKWCQSVELPERARPK